jgi:hypothetical protein
VRQPLTLIRAMSWLASGTVTASDPEMAAYSFRRNLRALQTGSSIGVADMVSLMNEPLAERFCNEIFDPDPESPIKKRADRAYKRYLTEVVPMLQEAQGGEVDQLLREKMSSALISAALSVDQDDE